MINNTNCLFLLLEQRIGCILQNLVLDCQFISAYFCSQTVSLFAKSEEKSWQWHARYGHLNFRALNDLGSKNMVEGIPSIKKVEQVCDGCVLGKQHRKPFPQVSKICIYAPSFNIVECGLQRKRERNNKQKHYTLWLELKTYMHYIYK